MVLATGVGAARDVDPQATDGAEPFGVEGVANRLREAAALSDRKVACIGAGAGDDAAARLMDNVKIPIVTVSLGGVETLITRPALSTHQGLSKEHRATLGIKDSLLRFSVGIESMDDIIDDLRAGLDA